eukprot:s2299_g14.t1
MVAAEMKSEARSEAKVLLKSVSRRYMACSSNVDYKDRWTERVLYADSMRWNWLAATDYAHAALYLGVEAVFLFFFITELRMRYRATLRTVPKVWFTEGDTCRQVLEDIPKHCSIFTESGWNIYDALAIFIGLIDSVVLNFVWQPGHRHDEHHRCHSSGDHTDLAVSLASRSLLLVWLMVDACNARA